MQRRTLAAACCAALTLAQPWRTHGQQQAEVGTSAEEQTVSEDEAAIRKAIDSYVAAFNRADAQAVAAHWTEQGEFLTPGGETLRGRAPLEASFTAYFAESKGATIELIDPSIDFLSPSVAVESGLARVNVPQQEPSDTQYEAIHVRTADGWKIDSVREDALQEPAPTNYERLKPLEWMIGKWSDVGDTGAIDMTCRWTTNQNFIQRSFNVVVGDGVDFAGTQIIGWDPANEVIRSWLFDSDGGFAVGRWEGDGRRWTVHSLHVMPDGRRASSTNIHDVVGDDEVEFRSIGRQVDGELLPNIGPERYVRVPYEAAE